MDNNIAQKIRALRESLGLKQTELARRLGEKDQSLVSKWERGIQKPNQERTAKLAELAGQTVGEWLGLRPLGQREAGERRIRIVGELQAGAWKEAIEWPYDDQYEVPVALHPRAPDVPLRGFVVKGPSMNKVYPDGSLVFVAPTIGGKIKLKSGQRVLVQRRSKEGLVEATLKEYEQRADGTKWLWPRSFDPEHQAPVAYKSGAEEVAITGVVVASTIMEAL